MTIDTEISLKKSVAEEAWNKCLEASEAAEVNRKKTHDLLAGVHPNVTELLRFLEAQKAQPGMDAKAREAVAISDRVASELGVLLQRREAAFQEGEN